MTDSIPDVEKKIAETKKQIEELNKLEDKELKNFEEKCENFAEKITNSEKAFIEYLENEDLKIEALMEQNKALEVRHVKEDHYEKKLEILNRKLENLKKIEELKTAIVQLWLFRNCLEEYEEKAKREFYEDKRS